MYAELEDQKDKSHMRLYLLHGQDSKYLLQCNVEIKLQSILYRMYEIILLKKTLQAKTIVCIEVTIIRNKKIVLISTLV